MINPRAIMACGILLGCASLACAQYELGDGRALDNNLQQGSGGVNASRAQDAAGRYQDALITGNVSGLGNFRGNVGYGASDEFRGSLGSDDLFDFSRRTAGQDVSSIKRYGQLGQFRAPPGSPGSGGILFRSGTGVTTGQVSGYGIASNPNFLVNRNDASPSQQIHSADGSAVLTGSSFTSQSLGLTSDEQGRLLEISSSPLTGVKMNRQPQIVFGPGTDQPTDLTPNEQAAEDRRIDPASPLDQPDAAPATDPLAPDTDSVQPIRDYDRVRVALGEQIGSQLMPARAARSDAVAAKLAADRMDRRLQDAAKATDADDAYNALAKAIEDQAAKSVRADPAPGDAPQAPATEDPLVRAMAKIKYDLPPVGSLAGQSKTLLNQALAEGDAHMAKGNFFNAEQAYDRAMLIQPDHPLALVGKAHAQLGAGLFLSSARTLRAVFADHPELIAARYTGSLLPSTERLATLTQKLDAQTQTYSRDVAAPLLLAYLAHQARNNYAAAGHLETLAKRSPDDPLIPLLKQVWLDSTKSRKEPAAPVGP